MVEGLYCAHSFPSPTTPLQSQEQFFFAPGDPLQVEWSKGNDQTKSALGTLG